MLKGFYNHLAVYIFVNTVIILISANVFSSKEVNFAYWGNYVSTFFWGFGLVAHGLYVFYVLNIENNIFKRWEEKKIKQFLEEDDKPSNN